MPGDELQDHLHYRLCFFVDFMPVNNCAQVLLYKHRVTRKVVAAITAPVPRPANLFIHVWRWLSCRCDPPSWYSNGISGTWSISGSKVIKHAFRHLHSFTVCLYSDSATFWGLIAHLPEQYLLLCHYSAMLLHHLAGVFFTGVRSLAARAGLLQSWLQAVLTQTCKVLGDTA